VCDECLVKEPESKREKNRCYDARLRDPRADAFYHSATWKNMRAAYLASIGYLCEDCVEEAVRGERSEDNIQVATDVHHVVPIAIDWSLRLSWSNLRGCCDRHHKEKRAKKP